MTNEPEIQKENEISFLDIFTVLLRYRRMICAIVLCSVVAAAAGYFFIHSRQKNEPAGVKIFETGMAISPTPGTRFFLVNQSAVPYFAYPHVIKDTLTEMRQVSPGADEVRQWIPVFGAVTGDERNYASANDKLFLKENIRSGVIEITFTGDDAQFGAGFLQSLFSHGSIALENHIKPLSKTYVETYESTSSSAADPTNYIMIKAIAEGKTDAVVQLYAPYVMERDKTVTAKSINYKKFALLAVFAAFFFSVFLAFCFNAVRNIKNDREAMQKIHAALGKQDA